jgi:phytoene/squalene synthetase
MRPMNPTIPYPMTSAERLDEVARLLALGFLRLRTRRRQEKANDPNHLREFGLDFAAEGSVRDTGAHADRERS